LRLPATVRLSSGLHRRPAVQPRLPICCDSRRLPISGSAFQLNLRLSSVARFFGQPPDQSPACAFYQSFSPAFQPIFNLRLRLTFRLRLPIDLRPSPPVDLPACLPTHLQLALSANLPAQPSRSRPACAFGQRSSSAFKPNLRLSSAAVFAWRCPLVDMRPSPLIYLPALPANATSDSHRSLYPSAAFLLICDLRRRSTFQPACGSNLRRPVCCAPSALPSSLPATRAARSTFQPSLWTQPPTHRLLCSRVVRSS